MNQEELRSALRTGVVTIKFTKHNGAARVMKATLQESYLPATDSANKTAIVRQADVLTVWDIEQNGWRSMRIDSIESYVAEEAAPPARVSPKLKGD